MKRSKSFHTALCLLPLSTVTILAQTSTTTSEETTKLETMVVTATANKKQGYAPPTSTTGALKSEIPLLETPQAVTVVDVDYIEDRHAVKLEEILRNVAGVSTGGIYGTYDQYRIRGFDASYNTFWDGLRGDNGVAPEMYGMEKVEIIKGPASTLYGNAPLGGVVNMVSKRPTFETEGEVGASIGSFNTYEGRFDLNSPLYTPGGDSKSGIFGNSGVYARIVGLYRQSDTFIDYGDTERFYIAPSVLFQISEDTKLTLLGSYTDDDNTTGMPLPASGTVLSNPNGDIRRDLFIGIPGEGNNSQFSRLRLGYEFSHKFNDLVSLRQNLNYTKIEQTWDRILYPPFFGGPYDTHNYPLSPYSYDDNSSRFGVDTGLDFKFDTFSVKHIATVGVDYYREKGTSSSAYSPTVFLDLHDPDYDQNIVRPTLGPESTTGLEIYGFYAQDHMKLTDQVSLTLGGRFDNYQDRTTGNSESAFSPKVGVTYEFVENVAAYANYSTSFEPQKDPSYTMPVEPMDGENIEAGIKYSGLEGKWHGMASIFQLTRSNAVQTTAYPLFQLTGEQRSRGFELENSLQLVPGLDVTTAYTYMDAEVTKDDTIDKGTPLVGVPDHTISAWLKYMFQDGTLKGFGAGIGGRYLTEQSGDSGNAFDLPAYGVLDAALYYENENFSAQLNFKNITDKHYYSGASGEYYVQPGEPFNITASATWKF